MKDRQPRTTPRKAQRSAERASTAAPQLPNLDVDLDDPAAMMIRATVLSIPASIMARFEAVRPGAPSHTALLLDALRAHAAELPELVRAARPAPRPGDLFPQRAQPGQGSGDRPVPLRIRPTAGELSIMDALTEWVADVIKPGPGGKKVSRSEVAAAALDAYLPTRKS